MCLLWGPWRQEELTPHRVHMGITAPTGLHDTGWGGSGLAGRELQVSPAPCGSIQAHACACLPRRLPQEHKVEVKASMKAVGAAGGPSVSTWDMIGQLRAQTWGCAHQPGETEHMEPDPTHRWLSVCPICLPICQNPERAGCRWARTGLPAHKSCSCQVTSSHKAPERQQLRAVGSKDPNLGGGPRARSICL